MLLTAVKLAPALAMGNTVVIKSSELAPATMFEFAKLIEKTGIPKGVVNVVTGFGDPCGKALTTHKNVERIAFTGGPETARHVWPDLSPYRFPPGPDAPVSANPQVEPR